MFNWLRDERDRSESIHNRSIDQDLNQAERSPLFDILFADHTDRRPDPPEINGRIPDEIRENELTGEITVVEKETQPGSRASREQNADLQEGALDLGLDFEMETVEDNDFWL
jgi:hypothetical protein